MAMSVKVTDLLLLPSGELQPPCIEVIHPETAQPSVQLLDLMGHVANHLAIIFEVMMAYLCGCNVKPFAGLPLGIIEYTEDRQKAFKCRYGYGTRMGDQIVPLG